MHERTYYVYLMTNWNNSIMYVGVINDLARRIYEYKIKAVKGFTEKYNSISWYTSRKRWM
jgi:putative endonuclease